MLSAFGTFVRKSRINNRPSIFPNVIDFVHGMFGVFSASPAQAGVLVKYIEKPTDCPSKTQKSAKIANRNLTQVFY